MKKMKKQLPFHAVLALTLTAAFLLILITAALSNCSSQETETHTETEVETEIIEPETKVFYLYFMWGRVRRFTDEEAGIVCWTYYEAGIDCLPISQTRLDK